MQVLLRVPVEREKQLAFKRSVSMCGQYLPFCAFQRHRSHT
jgi:hypothetical protein